MASRKQRVAPDVPPGRWKLLGETLQAWREDELGYKVRGKFAEDRYINIRLVQDLENNYRPGTYTKWALQDAAQAYKITYESILAFLHGTVDALGAAADAPPRARPPVADPARVLPAAPASELLREEAVYPYAVPIWRRVLDLVDEGIVDPTGAQLGLPSGDAKVWDGSAGAMSLSDRAWLVGDIRRRREARNADRQRDANSA